MDVQLLAVLVTIIGLGIALSVQVRSGNRRLDARIDSGMNRMESRMKGIETEVSGLGKEVAHLSGLVEGLREAVVHNRVA